MPIAVSCKTSTWYMFPRGRAIPVVMGLEVGNAGSRIMGQVLPRSARYEICVRVSTTVRLSSKSQLLPATPCCCRGCQEDVVWMNSKGYNAATAYSLLTNQEHSLSVEGSLNPSGDRPARKSMEQSSGGCRLVQTRVRLRLSRLGRSLGFRLWTIGCSS